MTAEIIEKPAFSVIGKLGSTDMGDGFVQRLWAEANGHFVEVAPLAKLDADGVLAATWGAMSDMDMNFDPWEEGFTRGLYLAGIEVEPGTPAPEGWIRWDLPGFRYLRIRNEGPNPFAAGLEYFLAQGYTLAGAVQDCTDLRTGIDYMCYPIVRL